MWKLYDLVFHLGRFKTLNFCKKDDTVRFDRPAVAAADSFSVWAMCHQVVGLISRRRTRPQSRRSIVKMVISYQQIIGHHRTPFTALHRFSANHRSLPAVHISFSATRIPSILTYARRLFPIRSFEARIPRIRLPTARVPEGPVI